MCRLWLRALDHRQAGEEGGVEHRGAGLADPAAEPVDDLAVLDHVGRPVALGRGALAGGAVHREDLAGPDQAAVDGGGDQADVVDPGGVGGA
jgi:hypothetical protein